MLRNKTTQVRKLAVFARFRYEGVEVSEILDYVVVECSPSPFFLVQELGKFFNNRYCHAYLLSIR
jgi:hypothetical protein